MQLFRAAERRLATDIAQIAYCNPFLPERIAIERRVLGRDFDEAGAEWNLDPDLLSEAPNVGSLTARATSLVEALSQRVDASTKIEESERMLYGDLVLCTIYHELRVRMQRAVQSCAGTGSPELRQLWRDFVRRAEQLELLRIGGVERRELAPLFAILIQICRAFTHIFRWIHGRSKPAVALRAAVWQSIFSHDMRRYRRVLHTRMGGFTTLITGPSGSGKELVARAIGRSHFIPFDARSGDFAMPLTGSFHALNVSALSETLIESELFGHKRGAFTGANQDRKGWLENCPLHGSVFLDELGEVSEQVQVKLLRVLEDRSFSRVGESRERRFEGKIIAATHRDLAARMQGGEFRADLYYRLCSDTIRTPSLRERIEDDPEERRHLVRHLAARVLGEESEPFAEEALDWIDRELGPSYPWPGNIRELDQCLRNLLLRRSYTPAAHASPAQFQGAATELATAIQNTELTADALLRRYCRLVYERSGNLQRAAEVLALDRRTVRAKIGPIHQMGSDTH
jgi:transcriptional regulator with AAA-type ATPase domain